MTKWQNVVKMDEMASFKNDILTKWFIGKMTYSLKDLVTKWQNDK